MKRSSMRKVSRNPKRRQRLQAGREHAREHHEAVRYCQAREYGIETPCGGPREHSHIIGKGLGGGEDYAVTEGACAILCQTHHREIDTRRAEMRAAGLTKPRPRPRKIVPRPIELL
jgi:hypothetical protein